MDTRPAELGRRAQGRLDGDRPRRDRQGVFQGSQAPADRSCRRVPDAYQAGVCDACIFDLAKAKELAAEGRAGAGHRAQHVVQHRRWPRGVDRRGQASSSRPTSGLKVNYRACRSPTTSNNQEVGRLRPASTAAPGARTTRPPGNFLVPLLATSSIKPDAKGKVTGDNYGRYSNPEFDALVDQGRGHARTTPSAPTCRSRPRRSRSAATWRSCRCSRASSSGWSDNSKWANVNMDFNENPTFDDLPEVARRLRAGGSAIPGPPDGFASTGEGIPWESSSCAGSARRSGRAWPRHCSSTSRPSRSATRSPPPATARSAGDRGRTTGRMFGLDKPLPMQYLNYLGNMVTGDLGIDFDQRRPVADMLAGDPAEHGPAGARRRSSST